CRAIRRESTVPILMLTARDSEVDKVVGLEIGADDYMTKPFSMRELLARVKAMLRRNFMRPEESAPRGRGVINLPGVEVDLTARLVRRDGKPLHLKPRVFDLLAFLGQNRGRVFSRDQVLEQVSRHA